MEELSVTAENHTEILRQVFQLNKAKDPEEDLQAAQIDARRLLLAVEQTITPQHEDFGTQSKLSTVRLLLGKSCVDSDEYNEAEKFLIASLSWLPKEFDDKSYDHRIWAIHLECLIMLGVVYSKQCKLEQSLEYLKKAITGYTLAENIYENDPPLTPEGFLINTEEEMLPVARIDHCKEQYTNALYYIAQVYLQMGHKEEATFYCQKTLARQLDREDHLDAHDWAINCASLAQVFLGEQKFKAAVHYLSCALAMEERIRESKPEDYPEFHANMHRCIASLGLSLLENFCESFEQKSGSDSPENEVTPEYPESEDFFRQVGLKKLDIDVEKIESAFRTEPPNGYEEARDVFLLIQRSLLEARDTFFKIDTHCNEYIDITRSYSKIFKLMASIEPDASRRIAMHRRRVDMLSALADRLNPQFYLLRYRQLTFELAETYAKMADIELFVLSHKRSSSLSTSKHEEKANKFADSAIAIFCKYLDSLRKPFNDTTKPLPDPLPETEVRAVICAYLSLGRLHSKKISHETRERLANLLKAEKYYKCIKSYCDRHVDILPSVQGEYDASAEMLGLMHVKLEAVRQGEM